MEDNSCVVEYIEIVPVDEDRHSSESFNVDVNSCRVKVCLYFIRYLCTVTTDYNFVLFIFSVIVSVLVKRLAGKSISEMTYFVKI